MKRRVGIPRTCMYMLLSCVALSPLVTTSTAAWVPPSPAAQELQLAVSNAVQHGHPATVGVPAGKIYFNDAAFNITGAKSITIGGTDDSTLVFSPGVGVNIQNSSDTTLYSVNIGYSPLPYVYGSVMSTQTDHLTMRLDPRSLTFETFVKEYPPHDIWPPMTAYAKGTINYKANVGSWGKPPAATLISGRDYSVPYKGGTLAAGDVIVAPTRTGFTVTLSHTSGITIKDVTIYAAGNMAITEFQGDGGNRYQNVSLIPPDASQPLASNADGFHSSGMRHGPTLSSVTMHNLLDDYFNVHNTFQIVAQRSGPTSVLVGDYQLFSGDNTLYATQETLSRVLPGESLSFFPLNTFTYPATATAVVANIERVTDPSLLPLLKSSHDAAAKEAIATPCSACRQGLNNYATAQLYNITFTKSLPPAVTALLLLNADNISNTFATIEDCNFTGSGSNLGRFKSSGGKIVRNSFFRGPTNQNLEIEPLQNWLEGMLGMHDFLIADNVFYGTSTSPVHIFGATNVRQINNTYIP
eukprot:m.183238 g.183238  ORF g.183238 m.183238 type:complete len:525 (-) comp32155_c0_seq1:84-1658(-)